MLLKAATEHGIDLRRSWMVGDTLDDVEAGRRAGCRTVLIENGGLINHAAETERRLNDNRRPHASAHNLYAAAERILADSLIRGTDH